MNELPEDLGALWRSAEGDQPLPPLEFERTDEDTRAAVQWMQAAWRAEQAPPAPAIPDGLTRRFGPRRRPILPLALPIAAAAALALWAAWPAESPEPAEPDRLVAARPERALTVDPEPMERVPVAAAPITFQPDEYVRSDDRLELVRGSVRVILLDPAPR